MRDGDAQSTWEGVLEDRVSGAASSPVGSLGPHKNIPCSGNPPRDSTGTSRPGWGEITEGLAPAVPVTVGAAGH